MWWIFEAPEGKKMFNEEAETPRGVQQVGKEPEVSFACHEYSIGCHD